MYEQPDERLNYVAKSYSSSAILKHLKAGTECACSAVFETCQCPGISGNESDSVGQQTSCLGVTTIGDSSRNHRFVSHCLTQIVVHIQWHHFLSEHPNI